MGRDFKHQKPPFAKKTNITSIYKTTLKNMNFVCQTRPEYMQMGKWQFSLHFK